MAINIFAKDNELVLTSNRIDIKILSDRRVFVKYPEDPRFLYKGYKIKPGLSRKEKELWLLKLRNQIVERLDDKENIKVKTEEQKKKETNEDDEQDQNEEDIEEEINDDEGEEK